MRITLNKVSDVNVKMKTTKVRYVILLLEVLKMVHLLPFQVFKCDSSFVLRVL